MSMKSSEIHNCSPLPAAKHAFHRSSDQCIDCGNWFWRFSLILQKWIAPSSSRCTCCEWRRRWITFFDISYSENEYFPGSTSVQVLLSMGMILGEEPAGSLLCGFAFDRHHKIFCIQFYRIFFELIFWNFLLIVVQIHHKLIWSMRNSDPGASVVSVHRRNSDLNSVLTMQAAICNFQYGPNFGVSLDPSFWFVMLLHLLEECIHDKPLHEIMRDLQCLPSWSIVQFQQYSEILHPCKICSICPCCVSFSIRSSYFCNRNFLCWVITIQRNFCLDRTEHEWGTWLSHHNRSNRSLVKGFILFTYLCDCSVKTELVWQKQLCEK